jgi:glycosyltransferase involved in cell wall biosynthesis
MVSVIIPTYNRSVLLKEAIVSVYQQSYRPIQCIVVDDGSTDNSAEIVQSLDNLTSDSFIIKYVWQENSGAQVARNKGTELATGEYIQYLDSDDLLYSDKLSVQISYLKVHPECDAVFGDWESGTPASKTLIKGYVSHDLIKQMLTLDRSIHTSAILFRKDIVAKIGSWDIEIQRCQEIDFHLRGILVGARYHYQSYLTGLWRYHENERIHNQTGADAFIGFYLKWERILNERSMFTREISERIADWYIWFLGQSRWQDSEKLLVVLEEAVRLKPSLLFYNTLHMRLFRLFFGRKRSLKIWLTHYLKTR